MEFLLRHSFLKSLFLISLSLLMFGNAFATNTSTGTNALASLTTGIHNTANGYQSLYSNTEGYRNTAVGSQSLYSNTSGSQVKNIMKSNSKASPEARRTSEDAVAQTSSPEIVPTSTPT